MLALVLVLTLCRGVVWASTTPPWWPPDEDYHWNYVHYVAHERAVPDPPRRFAAPEIEQARAARAILRARLTDDRLSGRSRPILRATAGRPDAEREPARPSDRQVLHPPLTYIVAAPIDAALGSRSVYTRLFAVRLLSVVGGLVLVWLTWSLACVVLRDERLAVVPAALTAVQPIIALSTSSVTNDGPAILLGTAVFLFAFRVIGGDLSRRTGLLLGGALGLALLTKATLLALAPLVPLAYLLSPRAAGERRRFPGGVWVAAGAVLAIAGWWYAFTLVRYGSATGFLGGADALAGRSANAGRAGPSLGPIELVGRAFDWLKDVYGTAWATHSGVGLMPSSPLYYAPLVVAAVGVFGLSGSVASALRGGSIARRQIALCVVGLALLAGPLLAVDLWRAAEGSGFALALGRFLMPVFPVASVLLVLGFRSLFPQRRVAPALAAVTAIACAQGYAVWHLMVLERYRTARNPGFLDALNAAAAVRPWPVGEALLATAVIVAGAASVAVVALLVRAPAERRSGAASAR